MSLVLLFVMACGLFAFEGYVDITNDTGFDIYYVYVSHESNNGWGEDQLGSDVLFDGETYRVYVSGDKTSIYDIMVEDEDGDTYTFYGVDVEIEDITVTLDDLD